MHQILKQIAATLTLLCLSLCAAAQQPSDSCAGNRPVTGAYTIGLGGRKACARYLSPVSYNGFELSLSGFWTKALPFAPHRAMMAFEGDISLSPGLLNPRGTASMQGVDAEFDWNMQAYWRLPHNLTVSVGGGVELEAGALALLRNSNNPVALNIAASIGAAASLSWRTRISHLPILASLRLRTPLTGAFFMPGYGETYYEIYVGNHSGLAHFAWPGNRRKIHLSAGFAMDFGRTAMEIGYSLDAIRANANNLVYNSVSNAFTISVIPGGLGIKRKCGGIRPF